MRVSMKRFFVCALCLCCAAFPVLAGKAGASAESGSAPGTVVLDSLAERYGPVTFDHTMHTYVADQCGSCHHVHNPDKTTSCGGCHDIGPEDFKEAATSRFLACSACHGEYDPEVPSIPGLKVAYHKQCFSCHRGSGELGTSPKACAQKCHTVNEQ
jgi:hypothetical protein